MAALGQDAGAAGVHALREGVGRGDDAGGAEGREVGAGVDFDGEHGVVLEVVADRKVDPVLLSGGMIPVLPLWTVLICLAGPMPELKRIRGVDRAPAARLTLPLGRIRMTSIPPEAF